MRYGLGVKNAMTVMVEGIIAGEAEMPLGTIVARWQKRSPLPVVTHRRIWRRR